MSNKSNRSFQAQNARFANLRTRLIAAILLLATVQNAHPAKIRYHGLTLNDQYRLQLEETDGTVNIFLLKKDRAPGGPAVPKTISEDIADPVIRTSTREALAQIRVEVLRTAAPNYLRNPGDRYRVTINAQKTIPGYTKIFEVDAAEALDTLYSEMKRIYSTTYGIRRDALYLGTLISLRILNEAQRLPAEIPLTVKGSRVGRIRIQGSTLRRETVTPTTPVSQRASNTVAQRVSYGDVRQRREHDEPLQDRQRSFATPKTRIRQSITPRPEPTINAYDHAQSITLQTLRKVPSKSPVQRRTAHGAQQQR